MRMCGKSGRRRRRGEEGLKKMELGGMRRGNEERDDMHNRGKREDRNEWERIINRHRKRMKC